MIVRQNLKKFLIFKLFYALKENIYCGHNCQSKFTYIPFERSKLNSVVGLLLEVVFVPLPRLYLAQRLDREQVVEVRLLRHLIEADHFVYVANPEAPMRLQNREECQ